MDTMNPSSETYKRQKDTTRSLIKFCSERGNDTAPVRSLDLCLQALEAGQVDAALSHYKNVPLGGMGCFNDWLPPPVQEGETHQTAFATFESLVTEWAMSMRLLESNLTEEKNGPS